MAYGNQFYRSIINKIQEFLFFFLWIQGVLMDLSILSHLLKTLSSLCFYSSAQKQSKDLRGSMAQKMEFAQTLLTMVVGMD